MSLEKIADDSSEHGAGHCKRDYAERFLVPIIWLVGWLGGWLTCLIWYGKLF